MKLNEYARSLVKRVATEYVDRKRDMTEEDLQAIAEWDSRFSQIKEELAKKDGALSDLNDVANWNYKPRKYAIKVIRKASSFVDSMETYSLYEVGCLFVKEAASRVFKYYKRRNTMISQEANEFMSAYSSSKTELPDLLNENFFKCVLDAIEAWQT